MLGEARLAFSISPSAVASSSSNGSVGTGPAGFQTVRYLAGSARPARSVS